jgi:ABC-type multidrug transport system fused ATPase/permease subunit
MINLLKKLWINFSRRRRKQYLFLQVLVIFSALCEMASIASVIPFLTILARPDYVYSSQIFMAIVSSLPAISNADAGFIITTLFIVLVLSSAIIRVLLLWVMTRISYTTGADLSKKIYNITLNQDYEVHISRNSSEVVNGIITKTKTVTSGVILPVLNLISTCVTILGIIIVLALVNAKITFVVLFSFGGLYLFVMRVTRSYLETNSALIAKKSDLMIKSLQEGLEGIREVLIDNNQKFHTNLYKNSDLVMRQASWRNDIIIACPRLGMEALGIVLIAIFAQYAAIGSGGLDQYLPIIGTFVLGAQKLLPALQKAYGSYSRIKGSIYSLKDVTDLLGQSEKKQCVGGDNTQLDFSHELKLSDISYRYNTRDNWILKNIDLTIPRGSVFGIVGSTGCGKSTLFDVMMGLLSPASGELKIDGKLITPQNKLSWQSQIACVPQNIFLIDATIEENIALGKNAAEIDKDRVQEVAKLAHIHDAIIDFENGYSTVVGERGVRLSGGQRQRIGIARALYKNANIIFFDEATSALDVNTEKNIMQGLAALKQKKTLIIIAHRLSTLKHCDQILKLGPKYSSELLNYEQTVKAMAMD